MGPDVVAIGIVWYVCFLFSLTCHEAAHALAAKLGGDPTASNEGQVTLNPLPHIRRAPFGTVLVPIISYAIGGWMIGWASAPYDPRWQDRYPKRAAVMALAGPAANFALALITVVLIHICFGLGVVVPAEGWLGFTNIVAGPNPDAISPVAVGLSVMFSLNLLLGVFNLIPVPPLDGSTAIGIFLSDDQARRVTRFLHGGPFLWLGIFVAWKLVGWIYPPVFRVAIQLIYPGWG